LLMSDILTPTGPWAVLPPGLVCVYTETMMAYMSSRLEVGIR
jgi:hypothetical protein